MLGAWANSDWSATSPCSPAGEDVRLRDVVAETGVVGGGRLTDWISLGVLASFLPADAEGVTSLLFVEP